MTGDTIRAYIRLLECEPVDDLGVVAEERVKGWLSYRACLGLIPAIAIPDIMGILRYRSGQRICDWVLRIIFLIDPCFNVQKIATIMGVRL